MEIKKEIQLFFSPDDYISCYVKNQEEQKGVCTNTFVLREENEIVLDIELQNNKAGAQQQTADLELCFSVSSNRLPLSLLRYCYPGREFVLSGENCDFDCAYGYRFPLSFVSAFYKEKGVTLIFDDQKQSSVGIQKKNDSFRIVARYKNVPLKNGHRRIILFFHGSDWHQGFKRYKSWYKNKYQENENIDQRLAGCYHIRRYFFNSRFCRSAIYNNQRYNFINQYNDDRNEVGGIDVALLFDYAYTLPNNIRCGNREPFKNLTELDELNRQLKACQKKSKLVVYAYFDPYLIQDGSDFDLDYRTRLPVLNHMGEMHHIWSDDQWHPCLSTKQWPTESVNYLAKVSEKLAVDGFYLDELGNGEQFVCHDARHGHEVPLNQNKSEYNYTRLLKTRFPQKLFMCEFFPADSNVSLFPSMLSDSKTIVDICRFAFPYKKIFKIIDCDRPIGNNTWDINKIFFNGMGLWLDNDLHNPEWYSSEVKTLIKKHYRILKNYSRIFESTDVEPLIPTSSDAILAHRFTKQNETIFTFINIDAQSEECFLELEEKFIDPYDIYNNKPAEIARRNGRNCAKIKLEAHSVGCIYVRESVKIF